MKKKTSIRSAARMAAVLALAAAAGLGRLRSLRIERDLPENVREISQRRALPDHRRERKTFLYTPDGAKDKFIEDFWFRREPDPDTSDTPSRPSTSAGSKKPTSFSAPRERGAG